MENQPEFNLKRIDDFERLYRKQVEIRHQDLTPPYFDRVKKIRIDELYVNPSFSSISKNKDGEYEFLNVDELIAIIYRCVILGNPGAGKTTLARKICYDFSKPQQKLNSEVRSLTPIVITLRDFSIERRDKGLSIFNSLSIIRIQATKLNLQMEHLNIYC